MLSTRVHCSSVCSQQLPPRASTAEEVVLDAGQAHSRTCNARLEAGWLLPSLTVDVLPVKPAQLLGALHRQPKVLLLAIGILLDRRGRLRGRRGGGQSAARSAHRRRGSCSQFIGAGQRRLRLRKLLLQPAGRGDGRQLVAAAAAGTAKAAAGWVLQRSGSSNAAPRALWRRSERANEPQTGHTRCSPALFLLRPRGSLLSL